MGSSKSIAVATIAAGISHLHEFVKGNVGGGYTWAVLNREPTGELVVHERYHNPCYGEMRPYAKPKSGHRDADRDYWEPELLPVEQQKVGKPTDLFWPFPKGEPLALGVTMYRTPSKSESDLLVDVLFNPDISPWRQCLPDTTVIKKGGVVAGIVFNSTDFDPTIAVNMFRKIAGNVLGNEYNLTPWIKQGATKQEAFILAYGTFPNYHKLSYNNGDYSPFGVTPDFSKLINGEANDLTDGGTFRQRYAYNRPKNDYIFKGDNFFKLLGEKLGKSTFTMDDAPAILSVLRSLVKDKQVKAA